MRRLTLPLTLLVALVCPTASADEDAATAADAVTADVPEAEPLRYGIELVLRHESALPLPPSNFIDFAARGVPITPWTGIRGGVRSALSDTTFWGADATLGSSQAGIGGGTANETNRQLLLLAGAHYGYGWDLGRARFSVLGLGEVGGTAGFRTLTVLGETNLSPLLSASLHVGAGFLFEVGALLVRTQCLGGLSGLTPTSMCSIGVGATF